MSTIKQMFSQPVSGEYWPIIIGQQFIVVLESPQVGCCNKLRLVTPTEITEFYLPIGNTDSLKLLCQLAAKSAVDGGGSFHQNNNAWTNFPSNVSVPEFEPFDVPGTDTPYKVILHTECGYVARRVGEKRRIRVELHKGYYWPFAKNISMAYWNAYEWETINPQKNYVSVSAMSNIDAQIKVGRGLALLLQVENSLK